MVNDKDTKEDETGKTMNNEKTEEDGESNIIPLDSLLEDGVSRQHRERKAVKSNAAAVPEYLWEEHLTSGSKVQDWNDQAIHNLRVVSSWLRERMMGWWKWKVVMPYVAWMKDKYNTLPLMILLMRL
jgi:hypothetical protein